jgi:hypothetical protein
VPAAAGENTQWALVIHAPPKPQAQGMRDVERSGAGHQALLPPPPSSRTTPPQAVPDTMPRPCTPIKKVPTGSRASKAPLVELITMTAVAFTKPAGHTQRASMKGRHPGPLPGDPARSDGVLHVYSPPTYLPSPQTQLPAPVSGIAAPPQGQWRVWGARAARPPRPVPALTTPPPCTRGYHLQGARPR